MPCECRKQLCENCTNPARRYKSRHTKKYVSIVAGKTDAYWVMHLEWKSISVDQPQQK